MKLGLLASHTIQYQSPIFRELAKLVDLEVYYAHRQSAREQADSGFEEEFDWDVDLQTGFNSTFLDNVARNPSVSSYFGCDCPGIVPLIREGGYDAFVVTGWHLKCYWQAVRACQASGVPVLVRGDSQLPGRGNLVKKVIKRALYPGMLKQFDGCLYVGKRNKEYLEYYGVPENRLFFSPHCVDNRFFHEYSSRVNRQEARDVLGIGPETKVCLFVGKLLDRKHPLDLVRALARVSNGGKDFALLFVGSGPLRTTLENECRALGVRVIFVGFVNQRRLANYYIVADMLILPSDGTETWGLVVNEGMACGLPAVVSSEVGCGPDMIDTGTTGMVFRFGNIGSLEEAILEMAQCSLSTQALQNKIDKYSPFEAAKGMVRAAESVMFRH